MGLYNRDYGREYGEETPWDRHMRGQQRKSLTIILIAITFGLFVIDMFLPSLQASFGSISWMGQNLSVTEETLTKPWMWWQLLTYGFVHDSNGIRHILFNMLGLFIFGRTVEQTLGQHEFLRFYLLSILFGGVIGAIGYLATGATNAILIGASGGVVAVTILFACKFPHVQLLLFFVLPVKAWILAVVFVGFDILGALGLTGSGIPGEANTAFTVHLAGAGFALLYHFQNWNFHWLQLDFLTEAPQKLRQRSRRMKLKIHDPDKKMQQDAADADHILAKIEAQGESSLTAAERKTLERYSKRLRKKRQG